MPQPGSPSRALGPTRRLFPKERGQPLPQLRTSVGASFYNQPVDARRAPSCSPFPDRSPAIVSPKRIPIPPAFYDENTEAPFEECLVCEQSLRDGATEYVVEKGIRSFEAYDVQETIFGYALCMPCHRTMSQSFSDISKQRCQAYLQERVDLRDRVATLLDDESANPDRWTQECIVHGTPRDELQEYQVLAHCHGDELLLTHLPVLIGGPAVDALVQRLSNETLDELGGFRDEYFGLPPELKRNPQGPVLA